MSRKQKIIVSITGIFLVLMILVGLTYAYFLTKITGNTNEKSISVSTANLVLEYGENTNVVQGINNAEPGYSVEKIFTATNKGNSDVTYGAALENIVNELSRQEDLVYTLTCTSYLKEGFNLASDGTITGTVDGTCSGVTTEKQFPSTSTMSIMTTNTIDTLHTQAYKLTVIYKEMGEDQSTDMNKTFSAKVNIVDLRANADKINPYSTNKNALNYQIVNSALEGGTNRTTYGSEVTTFTSISGENERVLNTAPDDYGTSYYYRGNVLDNYVTFAGLTWRIVRINGNGTIKLILDSYLANTDGSIVTTTFNGTGSNNALVGYMYGTTNPSYSNNNMCVKLNSAKTLAIIDSTLTTESDCTGAGYKWVTSPYDATHINVVDSKVKKKVDEWYLSNLKNDFENYIDDTLFCGDKSLASNGIGGVTTQLGYGLNETYYAADERLKFSSGTTKITNLKPTYECAKNATNSYSRYTVNEVTLSNGNKTNGDLTYPIGLLTADEVVFAGGTTQTNVNYYLYNSTLANSSLSYNMWTLMTPDNFTGGCDESCYYINYLVTASGSNLYSYDPIDYPIRPVINLKSTVLINSGNGTKANPYTVKIS